MPHIPREALENLLEDLQLRMLELQQENAHLYDLLDQQESDSRLEQAQKMLNAYHRRSKRTDLPDVVLLNLDLH